MSLIQSLGKHAGHTAVIAALLISLPSQAADSALTIAGFGGNMQKDLTATLWQPAADKVGAKLRQESHDGTLAQVRLQVQSGKPGWDIVHLGSDECAVGATEGLFNAVNYDVVKADGIPAELRAKNWVGINTYSLVLAWNTEKYKAKPPKNWADFWDVKNFPGRRALASNPFETMEVALLADGVAADKLYPLDTKRALASLGKLKKDVAVWYTTGAQSAQLIKDGEVDMIAIYLSRVKGAIKDGAPVGYTYEQGILGSGCLAVLKGSKASGVAQKFLAEVVSPALQARIPAQMPYYGPVNVKAYEIGKFAPEALAESNMSPANKARQVPLNVDWWRQHAADVALPFKQLIAN